MFGRFRKKDKTAPAAPSAAGPQHPPAALSVPQALQIAVAHHQAGRLAEAGEIYAGILDADPANFDALHLRGVVAHQHGEHARAIELISRALAVNPSNAQAHSNLGECYRALARTAEAESSYRTAIGLQPDCFDAHFNLGLLLAGKGEYAQARDALERALGLRPDSASGCHSLGNVLWKLGDTAAASARYEQAIALRPDFPDAHNNLGSLLHDLGDRDAAAAHFRQALALKPDFAIGQFNLGNVLRELGRREEARACYRSAVTLHPDFAAAHANLAGLYQDEGRPKEALPHCEAVARLLPGDTDAQLGLGRALHGLGRSAEARAAYERALALDPASAEAAFGLGIVLVAEGRHAAAADAFDRALARAPEMLAARWARAITQLVPVYSSDAELAARRASFAERLTELESWLGARSVPDGDRAVGAVQPFLLAYQDEPNRELLARCGTLCARLMADWRKARPGPPPPRPAKGARLRLGIVSAQIRDHSVWNAILRGWVAHLDPSRIELHVFHLGAGADGETAYAQSRAARFDPGPRALEQWVDLIAARRLDALIYPEVGMDTMSARLASLRLAPLQAASWGHPESTGLPTIDCYLSAADLEPAQAQTHYTERLVALPRLGCAYAPYRGPVDAPDLAALGLAARGPLLVCPGTPMKYTPANDGPLVEIARRLGRCRLLFFTHALPHLSEQLGARLAAAFERGGLDPAQFLAFAPWQPRPAFYGLLQRADVYLDSIGFSGFNTAMQALECALPVVTREGRFLRGRLASGILRRAGLADLVAGTDEAYVETAVRLARDAGQRAALRARIAESRSALHDDVEPVRALQDFLLANCGRGG